MPEVDNNDQPFPGEISTGAAGGPVTVKPKAVDQSEVRPALVALTCQEYAVSVAKVPAGTI